MRGVRGGRRAVGDSRFRDRVTERPLRLGALGFRGRDGHGIDEAEAGLFGDVGAAPPAGDGGQIVRRHRRRGQRRIARRRDEARSIALEPQHPIRKDVGGGEPFAQALLHRPQVLADDETPRPSAFRREHPKEKLQRILDIGAFGRRSSVRNPEEPG